MKRIKTKFWQNKGPGKPVNVTVRAPRVLARLIAVQAEKEGVSTNLWMVRQLEKATNALRP